MYRAYLFTVEQWYLVPLNWTSESSLKYAKYSFEVTDYNPSSYFSLCQGRAASRNLFTASSDSLFHPHLSLVFFFQSSPSPAFRTYPSTQSSHLSIDPLVSSCPPHVALQLSSVVRHPPYFLRVLPTVVCSSPVPLSSSSALPSRYYPYPVVFAQL